MIKKQFQFISFLLVLTQSIGMACALDLTPIDTIVENSASSEIITLPVETSIVEMTPSEELPESIFSDLSKGNPYYLAVKYLKDNNLVQGYPDAIFKPDQPINRAEAMKILVGAIKFEQFSGVEKPLNSGKVIAFTECDFPDVPANEWFHDYVCTALQNEVIEGYPDGTFKPAQTINNVESLKIAIMQSGIPLPDNMEDNFTDVASDDWFAPYTSLAKTNFFIVENKDGTLKPAELMTRSQFSLLIYRIIQNRTKLANYGRATYYAYSFDGRGTASGEIFLSSEMTAAHRTLPFGTMVKVSNLNNGNSVIVRINDRGPYVKGNIIDLSPIAFETLAPLSSGIINVEIIPQP